VNIANDVAAGGHVALVRLGLSDVDDAVEQICLAVLASEVLLCISCRSGQEIHEAPTLLRMSSWFERWVLQFLQP
jgi:hypothetical protein